ncbi:hypothetical protein BS47DRAFT_1371205 [Hydnum rufescens UP504]|uniref:NUC153 domain-containing protein n=1 Tax=Hydnum rufescens UP504 TaxID=1448309 RepID=A0A9P6B5A7_9AGAM|nr:hypothetical protein BS47DRAFT_1371205 [Hydnum rufescens UP504]
MGRLLGQALPFPDWLTRKRAAKGGKGKRAGTIDLIQHFEFPEASIKIKTTLYDLDELTLKFERHSNAENVDFVILSDDWTKTIQLQTDRTVELHTQGGLHYKTRIPKFGRAIAYHFPSCDAYISASGNEIYRLNLDQGRFLNPIALDPETVQGVNCIDINPAHQLLCFGTEGYAGGASGVVDFWDPRSRSRVGTLVLPWTQLAPPIRPNSPREAFSISSLASRSDGLSLAVGTSTGHTLLYDIRSPRAYAVKDQGYGLPVKVVSWVEGGSKMAGDGIVISADKKVVKLLGPKHRFLDNITEEMEDQTIRNVYEDFKFVERSEISTLGLEHLIGTPTLKPYMHGYFMSLKLYDAARIIANPFAYTDHREKVVQEKLSKLADSRIRTPKNALPKVNRALAEKILRAEMREEKKRLRKTGAHHAGDDTAAPASADAGDDGSVDKRVAGKEKGKEKNVLNDPRFTELFENPEFQVDETSREYALLNPAAVGPASKKRKTAVEEEEEESDRPSSDCESSPSDDESKDSSDEGELNSFNPRARTLQSNKITRPPVRAPPRSGPKMVSVRPTSGGKNGSDRGQDRSKVFGERRQERASSSSHKTTNEHVHRTPGGGAEITWIPSKDGGTGEDFTPPKKTGKGGVESFGAGMEKGRRREDDGETTGRSGRTKRRTNIRSGSRNTFRQL